VAGDGCAVRNCGIRFRTLAHRDSVQAIREKYFLDPEELLNQSYVSLGKLIPEEFSKSIRMSAESSYKDHFFARRRDGRAEDEVCSVIQRAGCR
jgi:hypothetical protein